LLVDIAGTGTVCVSVGIAVFSNWS